jgi:hypothetical protein
MGSSKIEARKDRWGGGWNVEMAGVHVGIHTNMAGNQNALRACTFAHSCHMPSNQSKTHR